MEKRYLSMDEAAEYIGWSWETIRKKVVENPAEIPPFINLGSDKRRIIRFDINDIDRWMEQKKNRQFEESHDKA